MRAVVVREYGFPGSLRVEELAAPVPGPGEVCVSVQVAGVNYPDLLVIRNEYQVRPPRPFSPGKELAGVVSGVGEGVTEFAVGDRVLALVEHGAYAEQVVARASLCHPIPEDVSFTVAAATAFAFQTAHFALHERGRLVPGEVVLVTGASGAVGRAAVQLAHAAGARVVAGIRGERQARVALDAGADCTVDLSSPRLRDSLREELRAACGGRGADLVVDPLGGDVFDAALRALAWRGRLIVVGFAAGRIPEAKANYLLLKNIAVLGLQWSDHRDRDPASVKRVQRELFDLLRSGRITPGEVEAHPLERFATALERVERRLVRGKAVLSMGRT